MITVLTFGTFDLLHAGHVRILARAAALGDRLVVGVSSDALNRSKKGVAPFYRDTVREEMVSALGCVDEVFSEESLERKADYVRAWGADVLVMGDDWSGHFDWVGVETGCRVVYLERTEGISTSAVKAGSVSRVFLPEKEK